MATMRHATEGLRSADRAIRKDMRTAVSNGGPVRPTYLLRPDGNTDKYRLVEGKIRVTRLAGHVTLGMVINPADLPCIVS